MSPRNEESVFTLVSTTEVPKLLGVCVRATWCTRDEEVVVVETGVIVSSTLLYGVGLTVCCPACRGLDESAPPQESVERMLTVLLVSSAAKGSDASQSIPPSGPETVSIPSFLCVYRTGTRGRVSGETFLKTDLWFSGLKSWKKGSPTVA